MLAGQDSCSERSWDLRISFFVNESLLAQAKSLPAPERLELIAALWETLDSDEIPVTDEERQVLEARMADIEANPSAEESWPEAKAWLDSRRS